jgi:hypothetical protein
MFKPALLVAVLASLAGANQVTLAPACSTTLEFFANSPYCNVSWDEDDGFPLAHNSFVVRFDVASQLPAGSTVNSATLHLDASAFTGGPFSVRELLATTDCATTWSGPFAGTGAACSASLANASVPQGGATPLALSSLALASVVQTWTDAPASNHGFLLVAELVSVQICVSNLALEIDFTPPCPAPVSYCIAAPNSQGPNGSHMSITGSTSLAANDMVLVADGVRPGAPGFFYFGATQQQIPLGNGYSCAGNPLWRLATPNLFADANGMLFRPVNFTVGSALNIQPGSVWNFQVKYRDIPGGGARYNFSDGLQVTFCP